jgi:general stress protein 26
MDKERGGSHEEALRRLGERIHGIRVAMLTTEDPDGCLRSRPMATLEREFDGTLWFFTAASSVKAKDVAKHHQVNLAYADPAQERYVSISGQARLVRDKAPIRELWTPVVKAWFARGIDDPDLALLEVSVEQAECWDAPSSRMVQLFEMVKAVTQGKPLERSGSSQHLDLH